MLATVGTGNSLVSAASATSVNVTFEGTFGATSQPDMTDTSVSLTGGSSPSLTIAGRTLTLNLTDGNLTSLTDVDGSVRTFTYNAYQQVVLDQWAPYVTAFGYAATTGRLTSVNQGLGSVWELTPAALPALTTSPATYLSAANTGTLTDPLGHVTTYTVDARGREIAETDANSATTTWLRDTAGEVMATTNALGNNTFMIYATNGTGDLLAIYNPDGSEEQYVYNGPYDSVTVQTLTGPGGVDQVTQFAYNSYADIIATTDPDGYTTTYVYGTGADINLLTSTTDPDGYTMSYTYDADRRVASMTDPDGIVTDYAYNPNGNGTLYTTTIIDTVNGNQVTTTLINGNNQLVSMTDPAGDITLSAYLPAGQLYASSDARGYWTVDVYDQRGFLTSETDAAGQANAHTTQYFYDVDGNLIKTIDPNGNPTTYQYDVVNNQIAVTDALGHVTQSAFNAANEVTATIDANGNQTLYVYDAMGQLVKTTNAMSQSSVTIYNGAGDSIAAIDPAGNETQMFYDADNRLIETLDPLGYASYNGYDPDGNNVITVNALGYATQMFFNGDNQMIKMINAVGAVTTAAFDNEGNQAKTVSAIGGATTETFDGAGRVLSQTDPLGRTTSSDYDANGNVTKTLSPSGGATLSRFDAFNELVWQQDPDGDVTQYVYDNDGNLVATTDPDDNTTTASFNADNEETSTTDALGDTQQFAYDNNGNQVITISAIGGTTATRYDPLNRVVSITDPAGDVTQSFYSLIGTLAQSISPAGGISTYGYDADGRQISSTDATGAVTRQFLDASGQAVASTDPRGKSSFSVYDGVGEAVTQINADDEATTTTYDGDGNVTAVTLPNSETTAYKYDLDDEQIEQTDALGNNTFYVFDVNGDQVETITAGLVSATGYDQVGRLMWSLDSTGITRFAYDPDGNQTLMVSGDPVVTQIIYSAANLPVETITIPQQGTTSITTDTYDADGNLIESTDANDNKTSFTDNQNNQQISMTDALGYTTRYRYDANGNQVLKIDPEGLITKSAYDLDDRLLTKTYLAANGTTVTDQISFRYDGDGNTIAASNSAGSYFFTLDNVGQVTGVSGPFGLTLAMLYDADGNQWYVGNSLEGSQVSTFNADNLLTSRALTFNGQTQEIELSYDGALEISGDTQITNGFTAGNMVETYTPQGQVASIIYYGSGSPAPEIDSFSDLYDAAGQVVSQSSLNGGTQANSFNGSGELTSSGPASYAWDAEGNPDGSGYTVNADNELTATPTDSLTDDADGQLIQDTNTATGNTWFFTYTGAGQMATATEYSASSSGTLEESVAYEYDAFGNRVQESVTAGGVTTVTQFAYDGWNPVKVGAVGTSGFDVYAQYTVGPYNLEGLPQQTTEYLDGDMVDQVFARIDSNLGPAWLEQDKNMSVCDITDGGGNLRDNIQFGAFGNVIAQTQYNGLGGATPETPQTDTWTGLFTFAGMQRDPATGLYYDNARYYSPSLQRFISPDPLGLSGGGTNLYAYTDNAPTDATDPSGMALTYQIPQNTQLAAGLTNWAPETGREVKVGLIEPPQLTYWDNASNNWGGHKIITEYKYGNTWVSTMAIIPGSLTTPGGGQLSVYPWGSFLYQPLTSFHGVDQFAVRGLNGIDGVLGRNWEDVNIEVGEQPPDCGCGDTPRISFATGTAAPMQTVGPTQNDWWTDLVISQDTFLGNRTNGWFAQTGNFGAGAADTITMGLTARIRQAGGFDNVDYNSGFYTAGQLTGTAVNVGLAFGNPCALGAGVRAGLQFINGAGAGRLD